MQILQNQVVRVDTQGDGHFHSHRTTHVHQGLDLVATTGEPIFAPFDGAIKGTVKPYPPSEGAKSNLNGFDFKGGEFTMRVFYADTDYVGRFCKEGEVIGFVSNVQKYYTPSMINHIHVELRDTTGEVLDPTDFLTDLKKNTVMKKYLNLIIGGVAFLAACFLGWQAYGLRKVNGGALKKKKTMFIIGAVLLTTSAVAAIFWEKVKTQYYKMKGSFSLHN